VPHRVRLVAVLVTVAALAGAVGVQSSRAADPSLTLNISANGSLEVILGNGTRIRTATAPGALIPPGPYLAIVRSEVPDDKDVFHMFHLSGPGVNLSSDLLPCENPRELLTVTLRPSSLYVYEDSRHPDLGRVVFTTSGGGSSAETSSSAAGPSTGKYSGSVANSSSVGSAAKSAPFRGTLVGTVGAAGEITLRRGGKAVAALRSGRYRIAVADTTPTDGFTVERPSKQPVPVTGPSFVGKRAVTLHLKPGRWAFYSTAARKHTFAVVA
jgi:hypothetical protein